MALILINGSNNATVVKSINLLINKGRLNLVNHPKFINPFFADSTARHILNSKSRQKSKVAVAFFIKENESFVINLITKIHPPAMVVVVSNKYSEYSKLEYMVRKGKVFKKFKSSKLENRGMIDYSFEKDQRNLKKSIKINSYII